MKSLVPHRFGIIKKYSFHQLLGWLYSRLKIAEKSHGLVSFGQSIEFFVKHETFSKNPYRKKTFNAHPPFIYLIIGTGIQMWGHI